MSRPLFFYVAPRRGTGRAVAVLTILLLLGAGMTASKGSRGGNAPLAGAPDQAAADVLHVATNQLGDKYLWGGNGPSGWDCSGLTRLWRSVGGASSMPRVSRDQQAWAVPIPRAQLLKGDLVFFGAPVTHVGLYSGGGQMLDASEAANRVIRRPIWTTGVIRYGRVPRAGMPKVKNWKAPKTATPAAPKKSAPRTSSLAPLRGLPGVQKHPSSRTALKAVAGARTVRGSKNWNDVSLVRGAWRHAGGGVLPKDRNALLRKGKTVRLADARVGDIVVYNNPATHLGIYLGHGYMIDASKTLGAVVVRRVYASSFNRLVRLG